MYSKILVATDGSTLSKKAVRTAVGLAASVGADVVALYVVARYPVSYFEGGTNMSMEAIAKIEEQWSDKGQVILDAVQKLAQADSVKVKPVIVRSDLVAESIMSTAKKNKCDLIVMASHGRKGLSRILLGSETQHVLTHSQIPVLVLR
jgi:nucleotide-binding universal stress UspA family protein